MEMLNLMLELKNVLHYPAAVNYIYKADLLFLGEDFPKMGVDKFLAVNQETRIYSHFSR